MAGRKLKPHNYTDRLQRAVEYENALSSIGIENKALVLLDNFEDEVFYMYGNMPNPVFVIGLDGKIKYKMNIMFPEKLDPVLEKLLSEM